MKAFKLLVIAVSIGLISPTTIAITVSSNDTTLDVYTNKTQEDSEEFLEKEQIGNITEGTLESPCSCQGRQTAEEYFTEVLKRIIGFVQRELRREKVPRIKLSLEAIDAISGKSLKVKKKRGKGLVIEGKSEKGERFLTELTLKQIKSDITVLLLQLEERTAAYKASRIVDLLTTYPDRSNEDDRIMIKSVLDQTVDRIIPAENPRNITEAQLRLQLFRSRISLESNNTEEESGDCNAVLLGLDRLILDGAIELKRTNGRNLTVLANFVFDSATVIPLDNLDQPGLVHFPVEGYVEIQVSEVEQRESKMEVYLSDFGMTAPGTNDFYFHKSITDINIRREIAKQVRKGLRQSKFSFNVEDIFEEAVFLPGITSALSSKKAAGFLD